MTRGHVDDGLLGDRVHRYLTERLTAAERVSFEAAEFRLWDTDEPVPFAEVRGDEFRPAASGEPWGSPWSTTWLRVEGVAPRVPAGCRIRLVVDLGFSSEQVGFQAEGLAYDAVGNVIKAVNPRSRWLPVTAGEPYLFLVEAAANPVVLAHDDRGIVFTPTALGDRATAGSRQLYVLGEIGVEVVDIEIEQLSLELRVLTELAWSLGEESARRAQILSAVNRYLDLLDTNDLRGTAGAARRALVEVLAVTASPSEHDITAVGHAHIDSAWLWPFRETRRKVARTVANVLQLMDEDDSLVHVMSSAQQFAWLQEDHPDLFARVRERVREGRFIPVGGMWVESDVTMPAGESLVMQLVHGTRFFEHEFGVPTTLGWLPDSFGYSPALPQLLRSAGAERFITQKMSWNSTNRFPHHTFEWEGIDGSRVITHFPSVDVYNSAMTGAELAHASRNLSDPAILDASLVPFGYGDGGGGPTREMVERARLAADLEGSPKVTIGAPRRFFDAVDAAIDRGHELPVWVGELYLEFHRGIFTSQARTKAAHRRVERLLREAQVWLSQATVRMGADYPFAQLETLWRELLLMEFHDVLPGSSIAWVHREAEERLEAAAASLEDLIEGALSALAVGGSLEVVANPAPFEVRGVAAHSIGPITHDAVDRVEVAKSEGSIRLRNAAVEVLVDSSDGTVRSMIDHATGRELVSAGGRLGLVTMHRDAPVRWDAWDVDASIDAAVEPLDGLDSIRVEESHGAASVIVERSFGSSTMQQRLTLRPGERQLRLDVAVDWQERERMLKLGFPLGVATERWQAETQYGYVERPTHRNTTWDAARFEACAHRWVRVAEAGFGVAVINDRTYGHDVRRLVDDAGHTYSRVRASLLRSTRYPDPDADRGEHVFRFAVGVAPDVGDAVRAGYVFTDVSRRSAGTAVVPLVSSSEPGVVVDVVKLAEDRSGDVIVRMFEARGARTKTRLRLGFDCTSVREVNILEQDLVGAAPDVAELEFRPFQLRTLRLSPRR